MAEIDCCQPEELVQNVPDVSNNNAFDHPAVDPSNLSPRSQSRIEQIIADGPKKFIAMVEARFEGGEQGKSDSSNNNDDSVDVPAALPKLEEESQKSQDPDNLSNDPAVEKVVDQEQSKQKDIEHDAEQQESPSKSPSKLKRSLSTVPDDECPSTKKRKTRSHAHKSSGKGHEETSHLIETGPDVPSDSNAPGSNDDTQPVPDEPLAAEGQDAQKDL